MNPELVLPLSASLDSEARHAQALFRLDLTRHLDPVPQLARARPDRVQLVAWAVRTLAENTDGLDGSIPELPGT